MIILKKKPIPLIISGLVIILISGCTNWEKEYNRLNVEHENTLGLVAYLRAGKGQLSQQYSHDTSTIEEMQKQIADLNQSPAQASGFGVDYDITFNSSEGTITVTLPNSILFDSGQAKLKKTKISELNHISSVIRQKYSNKKIDVIGHTDSETIKNSKWQDNWELSAQRALSVVRYLVKHNISKENIRAIGCGENQPVDSNKTAPGKAKNRRVEIVVYIR